MTIRQWTDGERADHQPHETSSKQRTQMRHGEAPLCPD